ncbi:MAG: 4Fe-4S dicluster domain-containing protein [bacterium]|nr:4Fe-4S dicluster domain-containing protein [bacterium]
MNREELLSLEQEGTERRSTEANSGEVANSLERRTFLKMAGFTVGAALSWGCTRGNDRKLVPYLIAPEEVVPGRPYWYASVCGACPAGCGVLTKNLDGRPVKIEGNPEHPVSRGGLCAVGQASVLALYDDQRLRAPLNRGVESTWPTIDGLLEQEFQGLVSSGARVRFLTDSCSGPADRRAIESFLDRFDDARLVVYDPISTAAILDAHEESHGVRTLPHYHLDKAEMIVSFGADFLGTWISPVEHTLAYHEGRQPGLKQSHFSYHVQLESRLSLTGSNADQRIVLPPDSTRAVLAQLAVGVARGLGKTPPWATQPNPPISQPVIDELGRRLLAISPGRSLVVCGTNDRQSQLIVNYLNELLGSYSSGVVDLSRPSNQRRGDDRALLELRDEMAGGKVDALLIRGVNPVYELPFGQDFAHAMDSTGLVICFSDRQDETAQHAAFVCPEPHYLESWGDSEPVEGVVALRQPVLRTIGSTRTLMESLATWSGRSASGRELLRESWRQNVFPRSQSTDTFDAFWDRTLHNGWAQVNALDEPATFDADSVAGIVFPPLTKRDQLVAVTHASLAVHDGRHAHNAWLQEMPDPISKTCWDNFASINPETAHNLGLENGDEVRVETPGASPFTIPVLTQPGLHPQVVAIPVGYGRAGTDRFSRIGPRWLEGTPTVERGGVIGANAAGLINVVDGYLQTLQSAVKLVPTGVKRPVAATQQHHTLAIPEHLTMGSDERRDIVRETTVGALHHDLGNDHGHEEHPSLWETHEMSPHHWGMVVDLSACTGCSACVVSCQAENNIPVVGRDEVARSREMHWMRIDRYFSGDTENVDVVHMPMMCQHCDNAPCETVCPVQATAQSAEGLNQQVYNRCVGTRYCANNCPYKVRRFNWFNYPREGQLQNMALNPDVTIRSRGVMEKCSLCVQRIQYAKIEAKREDRPIADGEIQPACAQSCPAQAITFGNLKDPESRLAQLSHDPRYYQVLAELGVKPVVGYLKKVRNRPERVKTDG